MSGIGVTGGRGMTNANLANPGLIATYQFGLLHRDQCQLTNRASPLMMKHSVTETGSAGTLTGTLPPPPAATELMLLMWQIQQEQKALDMLTAFKSCCTE